MPIRGGREQLNLLYYTLHLCIYLHFIQSGAGVLLQWFVSDYTFARINDSILSCLLLKLSQSPLSLFLCYYAVKFQLQIVSYHKRHEIYATFYSYTHTSIRIIFNDSALRCYDRYFCQSNTTAYRPPLPFALPDQQSKSKRQTQRVTHISTRTCVACHVWLSMCECVCVCLHCILGGRALRAGVAITC